MQEPRVTKKGNVFIYEEPYGIDYVEWSNLHPDTLVAYTRENESSAFSNICAYCPEEHGIELHKMFEDNEDIRISTSLEIDPDKIFGGALWSLIR